MLVNREECIAAGLDPDEVEKIAKGFSRYAKRAAKLGIHVFGGTGTGSLRCSRGSGLVVAMLDGDFDGGDGGTVFDNDGLERGENWKLRMF